jgi:hypothetical protein
LTSIRTHGFAPGAGMRLRARRFTRRCRGNAGVACPAPLEVSSYKSRECHPDWQRMYRAPHATSATYQCCGTRLDSPAPQPTLQLAETEQRHGTDRAAGDVGAPLV